MTRYPYKVVIVVPYSYDATFQLQITGVVQGKDEEEAKNQARRVFLEITDVPFEQISSLTVTRIGE